MRIIVFDTEATSLTPGQICQLSYLCVDDGQVTGKNYFFSVDEMSEGSQEVHGLSMDMLEELSGGRYSSRHDHKEAVYGAALPHLYTRGGKLQNR